MSEVIDFLMKKWYKVNTDHDINDDIKQYIDQLTEFIIEKNLWDEFMVKKLKISKDD